MKIHGGAATVSGHSSLKPKNKPKYREVRSRFLSPTSSATYTSSSSSDYEILGGLWPSLSVPSPPSRPDILANHIRDLESGRKHNFLLLNRQRSCTEPSRFEYDQKKIYNSAAKTTQEPILGSSMRYTGKPTLPGKSPEDRQNDIIVPKRFSVDENSVTKKPSNPRGLSDADTQIDSESEYSDACSGGMSFETPAAGKAFPASYMAPTVSSRKHGMEVPGRFMHDTSSKSRRWSADSGLTQKPISSSNNSNNNNDSPKNFTLKNAMIKANWNRAPSLGRSCSSISALGDNKRKTTGSKTRTISPSRGKGVGNIISRGIGLLKKKKKKKNTGSGLDSAELRLLDNRLVQWRYSNARAEAVNGSVIKHAECSFLFVWNGLMKLRNSVLQKRIQLQKEKLQMKLNYILHSQIKALESWENMDRQHLSAVSTTINYLHSVVCKVPLVDGAKVEPQSASIALRYASDLAEFINLVLFTFSPMIEKTVGVVAELAMLVTQEKLLLEECFELFRNISILEMQERSLMSSTMQLRLLQHQQTSP